MERMLLSLFVGTVNEQSRFGITATENINGALATLQGADGRDHKQHTFASEALWLWLHTLLNSAANVSKVLFPADHRRLPDKRKTVEVDPALKHRGELVRRFLQTDETSPLRTEERKLRNHLEHLDERLEDWWITDPHHNIVRRMIGPLQGAIVGLPQASIFEQYDPEQKAVAFRGDVYHLEPVVAELVRLRELTDPLMATGWWDWDLPDDWPEGSPFV